MNVYRVILRRADRPSYESTFVGTFADLKSLPEKLRKHHLEMTGQDVQLEFVPADAELRCPNPVSFFVWPPLPPGVTLYGFFDWQSVYEVEQLDVLDMP